MYPLLHEQPSASSPQGRRVLDDSPEASLTTLLGQTRATALWASAAGATTGEIARAAGVSASSASRHASALRDAGLITSSRHATTVLHTLTPAGASVLRAARAEPIARDYTIVELETWRAGVAHGRRVLVHLAADPRTGKMRVIGLRR